MPDSLMLMGFSASSNRMGTEGVLDLRCPKPRQFLRLAAGTRIERRYLYRVS